MTNQAEAAKAKFMEVIDAIDWEFVVAHATDPNGDEFTDADATDEVHLGVFLDLIPLCDYFYVHPELDKFISLLKKSTKEAWKNSEYKNGN